MSRFIQTGIIMLITAIFASGSAFAQPYYVSITGSDSHTGTLNNPFRTIEKAVTVVQPGETIYVRGGTWNLTATITLGKSGAENSRITLQAYPGEIPVLDFSSQALGGSNRGVVLTGNWWHIKGLRITGAGDNGMLITGGSNNLVEQCSFYRNRDSGLQLDNGATGNYIAERVSALDIPEGTPRSLETADKIRTHDLYERLVADNGGPRSEQIAGWIAEELGATPEAVLAVALSAGEDADSPLLDLKDGEWAAFVNKIEAGHDRAGGDFVVDGWAGDRFAEEPAELRRVLAGIGQVRRVREVRVLKGFRRHSPQADFVPADLDRDPRHRSVYPAIEMFGEGIFLRFDELALSEWESDPAVQARANILIERRAQSPWAHRLDAPEPRFIALHTIAHLLIRRLAFASGYSSASLQERIYANSDRADKTAGIFVYTAAGDAQGTLGGLVRLGEPRHLFPLLIAALDDADVCSNDPVCIESDRQGSSQLNLSACHDCALISETSCESGNRLLDRQLVLGGSEVTGLLESVLPANRRGLDKP